MQHRLKAATRAARARIVPAEPLDQFLPLTDDPVTPLHP
jgi:hypothetical protein